MCADLPGLSKSTMIGAEHDKYFYFIAKTGKIYWNWDDLQRLFAEKMSQVLTHAHQRCGFVGPINQSFELRKREVLDQLFLFEGPPFTCQRLAEILLSPGQYSATHKLLNALEKQLGVTSTLPVLSVISPVETATDSKIVTHRKNSDSNSSSATEHVWDTEDVVVGKRARIDHCEHFIGTEDLMTVRG